MIQVNKKFILLLLGSYFLSILILQFTPPILTTNIITKNTQSSETAIYIDGNDEFLEQAGQYGWEGIGPDMDPIIIEGINIDSYSGVCIEIRNVNLYYRIINCVLLNSEEGIVLSDSRYGEIINNQITECVSGIRVEGCQDIHIQNNNLSDFIESAILLNTSFRVDIARNNISVNGTRGIYVLTSLDCSIEYNNIMNQGYGIFLEYSSNNIIAYNYLANNSHRIYHPYWWGWWEELGDGIYLTHSIGNLITNNMIRENNRDGVILTDESNSNVINENQILSSGQNGVHIRYSSNFNRILQNNISYNLENGLMIYESIETNISNNSFFKNQFVGILLTRAPNNDMMNNYFIHNGLLIEGWEFQDMIQGVIESNLINGKSLLFLQEESGNIYTNSTLYGQVILLNCNNIQIQDQDLSYSNLGIFIAFCDQIEIKHCIISNHDDGVRISRSSNIEIRECTINNTQRSIESQDSTNVKISESNLNWAQTAIRLSGYSYYPYPEIRNNSINNCEIGIRLESQQRGIIAFNNIQGTTTEGISLSDCRENWILNNTLIGKGIGLRLSYSSSNNIANNSFFGQGLYITGWEGDDYEQALVENNSVNEKPLVYLINNHNLEITQAGQIYLLQCSNISLFNLNLSFASLGAMFHSCTNVTLAETRISGNNEYGIWATSLSRSRIENNTIMNNSNGIFIDYFSYINCTNNIIQYNQDGLSISNTDVSRTIFQGHEYALFRQYYTWQQAVDFCNSLGGHLATITSQAENDIVQSVISGGNSAWIGGTDRNLEGVWEWVTGEDFSYTNWDYGQPDDADGWEEYLEIYGWNGYWNDLPEDINRYFVCEWEEVRSTKSYSPSQISNNIILNNTNGIELRQIREANVDNNSIINNSDSGMNIYYSFNLNITNNYLESNGGGLSITDTSFSRITNNTVWGYGFNIEGGDLTDYTQIDMKNNIVNGKPLLYWNHREDATINTSTGQIFLINCLRVNIFSQYFKNVYTGIFIINSEFITVNQTTVNNTHRVGIYVQDTYWLTVSNTSIIKGEEGIQVRSGNISFDRNVISNHTGNGIRLENSPYSSITNNLITQNNDKGIYCYNAYQVTIENNTMCSNSNQGIYIDGSESSVIRNNSFLQNHDGMILGWGMQFSSIEENLVANNSGIGISVGSENIGISMNEISNNFQGILVEGTSLVTLDSNVILNNYYVGVEFRYIEASRALNNIIEGNGLIGILVRESWDSEVAFNYFFNNSYGYKTPGFEVEQDIQIPGSIVIWESVRVRVLTNHIQENYGVGIYVDYSNNTNIKDNTLKKNEYGLALMSNSWYCAAKRNFFMDNTFGAQNWEGLDSQAFIGGINAIAFNYWSEWVGPDADNDGYIDLPYPLDSPANVDVTLYPLYDPYPLVNALPPENYRIAFTHKILSPIAGNNYHGIVLVEWVPAIDTHDFVIGYSLEYSSNSGKSWQNIRANLITSFHGWNTTNHYDCSTCKVKVIAKSGEYMVEIMSDGLFSITNGREPPPPPPPLALRLFLFVFFAGGALGVARYNGRK